jgi:predicted TIM-barrel fold metal-dependent hydrolase
MIIDTHAHLWKNPRGLDEIAKSGKIEQIWLMHVSYYRGSVLKDLASGEEVLDVARRYPGLFIPFGYLDFAKGPDQVDRMKDQGFIGLKAIRPLKPYDDPSYFPLYERAAALNMPILFHVGIILKNTREEMTPNQSLGPTNMRPSMLDGIQAAFPDLPLIHGHMGLPWINELFESLYYYPRMYCSLCGYVDYRWLMDNLDRRLSAGNPGVETVCDRMMFATDTCYGRESRLEPTLRFAQFMEDFFAHVGRSYQWGAKVGTVLHDNARKILPGAQNR